MNIIDIIDERVNLRTLLENYDVKFKGNRFACPIHNGKNLNCILTDRPYFHCFKCGINTNAISFVRHKENCDTKTAIGILDKMFMLGLKKELPPKEFKKIQQRKQEVDEFRQQDIDNAFEFLDNFKDELPLTKEEQNKFIGDWIEEAEQKRMIELNKPKDENKEQRHEVITELRKVEKMLDSFDLTTWRNWDDKLLDDFMALKKNQFELDELYWELAG